MFKYSIFINNVNTISIGLVVNVISLFAIINLVGNEKPPLDVPLSTIMAFTSSMTAISFPFGGSLPEVSFI